MNSITSVNSNAVSGVPLQRANTGITQSLEKLSSGSRINRAADDAAGLQIASQLASQILGSDRARANLNDAVSLVQTAEGALGQLQSNVGRIRELSVAAANSTLSAQDRQALAAEAEQLAQSNDDIVRTAEFNGQPLFQGNSGFNFQTGPNAGDQISFSLPNQSASSGLDFSSAAAASASLTSLDQTLSSIADSRAQLGAVSSRFSAQINALQTSSENLAASRSRIADTDYASATSQLVQQQISQQAALAVQTQANALPSVTLSLLR
ncbi:flagellin [Parachitinimonas caeni]|uniref:Flagellin n=1 Tax=Parachitinimonas caeni TaxID=3031301 RepID=A0ABT7DYV8_9NEIS|nr:flagellin [Parachitinimonas caeni]MDK2125251.1 flagellin [Parachitinimonas caeni]